LRLIIKKSKKESFFSFLVSDGIPEWLFAQHYFKQVVCGMVEIDLKQRIS